MQAERPPTRTFKPRRRLLSPTRAEDFERLGPVFLIDERGPVLDLADVFARRGDVVLEIGIGFGDTLIEMSIAQPDLDAIGCDVHTPGIAASLSRIDEHGLSNVRLMHGDALDFLPRLATGTLTGVRVFFPDPWPKQRQRHRRLVRADIVAQLVDRVKPGGWLHLATDIDDYARQMQRVRDDHPALTGGVIARPAERPISRYERKGLDAGHTVVDLWYNRA